MKKINTDESATKYLKAYTVLRSALVSAWEEIRALDPTGHRGELARCFIDRALLKAEAIIEEDKS